MSFFNQAQSILQNDFPVLSKIYEAGSKKADFIIAIDESGSMRPFWNNLTKGVSALVEYLPDDDYLSVLGFASYTRPLLVPSVLNDQIKTEIRNKIESLPAPTGQYSIKTDLFEAIDKVLDEINRPNSNELKFVFFISDYINDPPPNSRWNSNNFSLLNEKYDRVVNIAERPLRLYALQLPLEIQAGKDYDKFANIFQTFASPIMLTQTTLFDWFERMRAEIEREKLRLMIETDLKNAVIVTDLSISTNPLMKDSHFALELHNASKLNLRIDSVMIATDKYGILKETYTDFSIKSDSKDIVSIELNEAIKSLSGIVSTKYPLTITEIKIFTSSDEKTEFGKLNMKSEVMYFDKTERDVHVIIGFSYLQAGLAFLVLLILLWYLFYPCIKPVWLFNKKNIRISMDINDKIVELTTREFNTNKKSLSFDNNIIVEDQKVQTGLRDIFKFTIKFEVKKPKCVIRTPKPGTYVSIDLPENTNYSFTLYDNATGKGKEYKLGNKLTSEPIDFRRGAKIESTKLEQGESYKLRIIINPKS